MFIRSHTSQGRSYRQLVRGYRDENGAVRQKTIGLRAVPRETVSVTEAIREELAHEREWLRKCRRERRRWTKHDTAFARKQHARWEQAVSRAEDKIKRLEAALVDTTGSARATPASAGPDMGQPLTRQPATGVPAKAARGDYRAEVLRGGVAIARALGTTPKQVRELRARHGLPTFTRGGVLCSRVDELYAWRRRWQADAEQ